MSADRFQRLGKRTSGTVLDGAVVSPSNQQDALLAILLGTVVIAWMVASQSKYWPEGLAFLRSPFHDYLVIVRVEP